MKIVSVVMSEEEYERVRLGAFQSRKSVSAYCRERILSPQGENEKQDSKREEPKKQKEPLKGRGHKSTESRMEWAKRNAERLNTGWKKLTEMER